MLLSGFEPAIPEVTWLQTYVLDLQATVIDRTITTLIK